MIRHLTLILKELISSYECYDDNYFCPCCSVNKGMKIEEFKFIYWMKYAHCMWGRALGVMFSLPYSYFLHTGYITLRLGLRLFALFALAKCWAGSHRLMDGQKWFRGWNINKINFSFYLKLNWLALTDSNNIFCL